MQVMTGSGSNTGSTVPAQPGFLVSGAAFAPRSGVTLAPMRLHPLTALALAGSLALTACGGSDAVEAATTSTTTRPTTTTTTRPATTTTTVVEAPTSMLTGVAVEDESILTRPVVAVKFDNADGKSTPQAGINEADVVYEVTVEGQVTRFLALYQSRDAGPIGPIRSARGSEIGLLEELHAPLFTWHGANALLASHVRASAIIPRSIDDVPHLFYRDRSRRAPYNSFAQGTAEVRATAPEGATGPEAPILHFGEPNQVVPSPVAVPVESVTIRFPAAFSGGAAGRGIPVRFDWDGERWARFQNGRPHVDVNGVQVATHNVIVRFTGAVDSGTRDQAGSVVPTAQVTGEGEAWIFSDGKVATGTWSKPDNATPATYRDVEGNEIALMPGTTWIAMPYGSGASSFG